MMSSNKRKIFASDTSDEDDSFKHRRSSLRVNLSTNLTDSGNGSLWRTQIENDERAEDAVRIARRLSRSKGTYKNSSQFDPDNKDTQAVSDTDKCAVNNNSEMSARIVEGIQLKRLTINLKDISTKERHLERSCKTLKDAILSKTKQMFDRENELSVKTAKVLGNKENHLASGTCNPNTKNKTVVLDTSDCNSKEKAAEEQCTDTVSDRRREDRYLDIIDTPTNGDRRRSLERTVDKSRLTQRRLFVEKDKQVEEQAKCKIIGDIALKNNLPLSFLKQANQSGSPILSGSNRRLSLLRGRSKLYSQNRFENLNNSYSTVQSIQSIDNIDTEMPVCSTFIEDNAMDEKGINNDVDASRATCTTNKVISMEMTEVYGGIHSSEKHVSLQNRNSDINNCNENSKEERFKEGSMKRKKNAITLRLEDVEHSINKSTANDVLQAHECNSKTKCQNEECSTISLSDSSNTIRSSLNVNTSLDAVTRTNEARNVRKSSDYRTNDANQDFEAIINNKESIVLSDQRESTNTIRTSLQMNTSIDFMRKRSDEAKELWRRRSDEDDKDRSHSNTDMECSSTTRNKETNDIDSLENISLIERLRNISMRDQVPHNDKSRVSKMKAEDKRRSSNSGSSYSCVEGTPYPISRSVLFRSQLKCKTQHLDDAATCSSNLNFMDNEENNDKTKSIAFHSKVSNEMHLSTQTQKTIETNTVILEDTLSCNPFIAQNQLTVIKDTPDGAMSETDESDISVQNTKCVPVSKGKRKLLPLKEDSQLCSITPAEETKCTPEVSSSAKRVKRLKKKLPKRKSIRSKNNKDTNNIKQDTASTRMWSDSDSDIPENKKTENKKVRKPKKVISKKIVVKKFVDENVLNILQENRQNKEDRSIENRDSLDDFVKCRTTSTQLHRYKSQKIVIVTTGLSRGDKSLVKSIVKSLGKAEIELNVSRRTTHVVSTGVRTVNLLRGIIRGCWLITLEWVLKSLENDAWLDPETFEMKHFSKAVQENRRDRQLFGPMYVPELFSACGFIYVEHKTTVPCDTLKQLIKTAGGHITENTKLAKIIIGANGLKETWVIDSITTGELQLPRLYQRK